MARGVTGAKDSGSNNPYDTKMSTTEALRLEKEKSRKKWTTLIERTTQLRPINYQSLEKNPLYKATEYQLYCAIAYKHGVRQEFEEICHAANRHRDYSLYLEKAIKVKDSPLEEKLNEKKENGSFFSKFLSYLSLRKK